MGALSEDTFGNDTECDWIGSFLKKSGLGVIREAIDAGRSSKDYLDSDQVYD